MIKFNHEHEQSSFNDPHQEFLSKPYKLSRIKGNFDSRLNNKMGYMFVVKTLDTWLYSTLRESVQKQINGVHVEYKAVSIH